MGVIDVDPEVLQWQAEATAHAGRQALIHVEGEQADNVPGLMKTLVPEGPYAFTLAWRLQSASPEERATMKLPIGTTREEVETAYVELHQHKHVVQQIPFFQIRGAWYEFQEGQTTSFNKDLGHNTSGVGCVLFPVGGEQGITGELLLGPRRGYPAPANDEERHALRLAMAEQHDAFIAALCDNDVPAILQTFTPDAQSGIRDYVHDTGTLVVLDGEDEHREYYDTLLGRYRIESVEIQQRVVQHNYLFAELRYTMRDAQGRRLAFHTAELQVPGPEARCIDRIGHGTDLAYVD